MLPPLIRPFSQDKDEFSWKHKEEANAIEICLAQTWNYKLTTISMIDESKTLIYWIGSVNGRVLNWRNHFFCGKTGLIILDGYQKGERYNNKDPNFVDNNQNPKSEIPKCMRIEKLQHQTP